MNFMMNKTENYKYCFENINAVSDTIGKEKIKSKLLFPGSSET